MAPENYNGFMVNTICKVCGTGFYAKPSHKARGWGRYCSKACQYKGQMTGTTFACSVCGKDTYKNKLSTTRSKSGKYFCNKSCQTIWRNSQYSGEKHLNWVTGKASYRAALQRTGQQQVCQKCKTTDKRVLAVHHKDRNRDNNNLSNLMWLCHNCHYLVHHDKPESVGFVVPVA